MDTVSWFTSNIVQCFRMADPTHRPYTAKFHGFPQVAFCRKAAKFTQKKRPLKRTLPFSPEFGRFNGLWIWSGRTDRLPPPRREAPHPAPPDPPPAHDGSVAVSNLIQHNDRAFLSRNDASAHVHFCTPLITMPYAPLRSKIWDFTAVCAYISSPRQTGKCS